jgi:hypothetical protein
MSKAGRHEMGNPPERLLTESQAYAAMFRYLERYYAETQAEEAGIILGELRLIGPRKSADGAAWPTWIECVDEVLATR